MTQRYQNELEKESPKNEAAKATPEASKNTRETNDEIQEDNTEDSPKNESAKATPEASKNTGETNDVRRKDNTRAKSFFLGSVDWNSCRCYRWRNNDIFYS